MNIFEQASRQRLRFESNKGALTVEHLWDLPRTKLANMYLEEKQALHLLTPKVDLELELTCSQGGNEVTQTTLSEEASLNKQRQVVELRMSIIAHIIKAIAQDVKNKQLERVKESERARIKSLIDAKRSEELNSLSIEDLEKRLAELN